MTYSDRIAHHYDAYRPPLHRGLLARCLPGTYARGLDVGCGTGTSAVALTAFCRHVLAYDPSAAMLARARSHPGVEYRGGDAGAVDFGCNRFDVVTLAGSLYYAKSQRLLDQLVGAARPGARIVVYDFGPPPWDEILRYLGLEPATLAVSEYDYRLDFEGLDTAAVVRLEGFTERWPLKIAPAELLHWLLSEPAIFAGLATAHGTAELFDPLLDRLRRAPDLPGEVMVPVYATVYRVEPAG